jgi:hypothetical protein
MKTVSYTLLTEPEPIVVPPPLDCDFLSIEGEEGEGGWGEGGWGEGPWGGEEVVSPPLPRACVRAIRENVVRVKFTHALLLTGLLDSADSLSPEHYAVDVLEGEGLDGSDIRSVGVILVERVEGDSRAVDIYVDRPLTHYPAIYVLRCLNMYDSSGVLFAASVNESFNGLQGTFNKPVPETYAPQGTRDFANPSTKDALFDPLPEITLANLGTFPYGDDGDYGHDEGPENLKKRVVRRCVVKPGGFVWLQEYGVGVGDEGKKLNNAARRERIKATIKSQVMQEPDVRYVAVNIKYLPNTPGLVWLILKVVTVSNQAFKFDVPFVGA